MTATERADEFGVVDDDMPKRRTALDFIRQMQSDMKAAEIRTVSLRDPERPEFELVCEVPTDMDEIAEIEERAEKVAKSDSAPSETVVAACMKLARYTRILRVRGAEIGDGEGSAFADPGLVAELGGLSAWRAVRQLFITSGGKFNDMVIVRLLMELQAQAGMNRTGGVVVGDADDPT